ncbi:hypothetical protein A0H81_13834 [Grifola frondosa]|uniref:Uncharacterized protein n=1 Tax=Grifola frondosa TaxID=5627 RepID=A0A1C7LNG9_GRIFR|nr:hypothetical protein A0H81_13834 [Grifola frondosa]
MAIFDLIGRLIEKSSSAEIAIDDRHGPKLHARFLTVLLAKHRGDVAAAGHLQTQHPPPQSQNQDSHSTIPGTFSSLAGPSPWPNDLFQSGQLSGGSGVDETLGALLALQSPAYWKDAMLGFSWPESQPAPSEECTPVTNPAARAPLSEVPSDP